MKKIVSNVLIVSSQLIVGGLFLFMLFSDKTENSRVVVVENNNLDKMADAVSELFVVDHAVSNDSTDDETATEEELKSTEQKQKEEEEKKKAEEEAARLAQEAEAKRQQEEATKKAQEEAARNATVVDASGYISKPAMGFNVTTGNRTYSLNNGEFSIVAGVVACEAVSKDDALAVMSVILNRADNRGMTPVQVVSQAGQFSCYYHQGDPSRFASVVTDALNGIRNNNYNSFNGAYSGVSDNYIVSNGNRFY